MSRHVNRSSTERVHSTSQAEQANRPQATRGNPIANAARRVGEAIVRPDDYYRRIVHGTPLPPAECWRIPGTRAQSTIMLYLAGQRLHALPDYWPPNVVHLNASNNLLETLPNQLPRKLTTLKINKNRFQTLPNPLPQELRHFEAFDNQLQTLPTPLPPHLITLDVSGNQIQMLTDPLPQNLYKLDVAKNRLQALPNELPESLKFLDASHNQLQTLPRTLPNIARLNLSGNQLREVDANLFRGFTSNAIIDLSNNPLSPQTSYNLSVLIRELGENGPQIIYTRTHSLPFVANRRQASETDNEFDQRIDDFLVANYTSRGTPIPDWLQNMLQESERAGNPIPYEDFINVVLAQAQSNNAEAPNLGLELDPEQAMNTLDLGRAAEAWAMPKNPTNMACTRRLWQSFAKEPGAQEFAQFLKRLGETLNANDPPFQNNVARWLRQLEGDRTLREDTFAISIGATESCEDRVSLTYNTMRKLSIAADVSHGNYDERLPELVTLARGMLRLELLERLAYLDAKALAEEKGVDKVDEVEVYLAFQVMLREKLDLPVDTTNMAFFRTTGMSRKFLKKIANFTLDFEKRQFLYFLSCEFLPWRTVLQRLTPDMYEQAQNQLIEDMGDEFTKRLNTKLQEVGLLNDPDAERTIGADVRMHIEADIFEKLTKDFLASKGMLHLLKKS